jgi:hypothetical protein
MSIEQMHGQYWAECKKHRPEWQGPLRGSYREAREDEFTHYIVQHKRSHK